MSPSFLEKENIIYTLIDIYFIIDIHSQERISCKPRYNSLEKVKILKLKKYIDVRKDIIL